MAVPTQSTHVAGLPTPAPGPQSKLKGIHFPFPRPLSPSRKQTTGGPMDHCYPVIQPPPPPALGRHMNGKICQLCPLQQIRMASKPAVACSLRCQHRRLQEGAMGMQLCLRENERKPCYRLDTKESHSRGSICVESQVLWKERKSEGSGKRRHHHACRPDPGSQQKVADVDIRSPGTQRSHHLRKRGEHAWEEGQLGLRMGGRPSCSSTRVLRLQQTRCPW